MKAPFYWSEPTELFFTKRDHSQSRNQQQKANSQLINWTVNVVLCVTFMVCMCVCQQELNIICLDVWCRIKADRTCYFIEHKEGGTVTMTVTTSSWNRVWIEQRLCTQVFKGPVWNSRQSQLYIKKKHIHTHYHIINGTELNSIEHSFVQ